MSARTDEEKNSDKPTRGRLSPQRRRAKRKRVLKAIPLHRPGKASDSSDGEPDRLTDASSNANKRRSVPERLQRVKRERFLPYAYERSGIGVRVANCLDEQRRSLAQPDFERHLIELDDRPWQAIRLDILLQVTAELLERLLPDTERAVAPFRLLITVRSPATRLRMGFVVADAPIKPGEYRYALKLSHTDIVGPVEIAAFLVCAKSAVALSTGYAAHLGGRVAGSRPWQLLVEPRQAASGDFLDVRYRSFKQDALLKQFETNLYRLECDQEAPVLWVNADQDKIAAILGERGTVGRRARMRDLFYDVISYGVWTQLFTRAARHLADGELVYEWEEAVLRELLPFLYPQKRDHGSRVSALIDLLDYGDWPLVMERLDAALQVKCDGSVHMARLIEETIERQIP